MSTAPREVFRPRATRGLQAVLWLLILAAGAEFVIRGPLRFLQQHTWNDLAQNYAATKIWLRGQNFAQPQNFVELWKEQAPGGFALDAKSGRTHLAPPPGTLVLMAPIGALPWPIARVTWMVLLVSGFGCTVWALIKTIGFGRNEPRTLAFMASCLALAPFHTGIAAGNQTILIVGFCALGILAASGDRDVLAGLLFGVACSLKPQLGSFVVLYYLVRRRWRLFFVALGFTIALMLVAAGWMQVCGISWTQDYLHNVKVIATQNRIDDFTSANPIRFLLINLQVPVYSFTHDAWTSNIVALSAGALLTCTWIFLITRERARSAELLALATIAVICLLPVYHRLYDAALLTIPLAWCISEMNGGLRHVAKLALIPLVPFLIPGPALLQQLASRGYIPDKLTHFWWWDDFVMPHQTWALLVLCSILLFGLYETSGYSNRGSVKKI